MGPEERADPVRGGGVRYRLSAQGLVESRPYVRPRIWSFNLLINNRLARIPSRRFLLLAVALLPLVGPARPAKAQWRASVEEHQGDPPAALPDGRVRLGWFYFGSPEARPPGANALGGATVSDGMAWVNGMVRLWKAAAPAGSIDLGSGVEAHAAVFQVMVPSDTAGYRVVLTLGHPTREAGFVELRQGGGRSGAAPGLTAPLSAPLLHTTIAAGRFFDVGFELGARDGVASFQLSAEECRAFSAVSFALYGPRGMKLPGRLDYAPAPLALATPPRDSLAPLSEDTIRSGLDHLGVVLRRAAPADGGFSYEGSWYQNAYPLRTLLAARGAARPPSAEADSALLRPLDAFVATQRVDGAFSARYFGPLDCLADAPPDNGSMNLADIGTMMTTVNIAAALAGHTTAPYGGGPVDADRATRYLAAARRYADGIVLPNQMSDGCFPNLRFDGQDFSHPYSVATATQVANLATLYAATGEPRYRAAAMRAARWLAATIQPDGRVQFYPHDNANPTVKEITEFGDTFYILEALTWAWTYAERDPDRAACHAALDAAVWGQRGLFNSRVNGVGWQLRNRWSDSKLPGMLYVLCRYRALGGNGLPLAGWIDDLASLIADPERMKSFGIGMDPIAPGGDYALSAAGFAGVGLAAALDPRLLVPAVVDPRR